MNCCKAAREAALGCSPPAGRGTRPLRILPDKSEFSNSDDTEQGRMGNDNFRTVHALAGGTAAR